MSETMIERVALAIKAACDDASEDENEYCSPKMAVAAARAAIEAMRWPTDDICRAIDIAIHEFEPKWGPIARTSISLCVQGAFFDAALSQSPNSLPSEDR